MKEFFTEAVLYRLAYSHAAALAESRACDMPAGRSRGSGIEGAEAIAREVARRIGTVEPANLAIVREAIGDALEGRRPKW